MASRLLPSNIPLHCNICPRKPDFSDVSHLLTHIASKGHLSTYYKIKVRSATETESRNLVDNYDNWYARWNIEDLMAVRLNLKEKRKSRRPHTTVSGNALHSLIPALSETPGVARLYDHPVDPRLTQYSVKTEVSSRSITPLNVPFVDPSQLQHAYSYAPPMRMWSVAPYMAMVTKHEDADDASSEGSFFRSGRVALRSMTDNASLLGGEAEDEDETPQDTAIGGPDKLKGILWPGMDMFDSALPEQKRKRNQKKDTSVVEQLEAMSRGIDRTELIFTAEWTFCKGRKITGYPDHEDSPVPGEEVPSLPKKNKRGPRKKPLAEKDPNTGGRTTRKKQKKKTRQTATASKTLDNSEQVDDDLLHEPQKSKRKKALTIYRDEEVSFDQPAEMNYLTSEFQHAQPDDVETRLAATARFRPGESVYVSQQSYFPYQPSYQPNPFIYDPSVLPNWEHFGYDTSGSTIANPFFSGSDQPDLDDEGTISVVSSQQ